MVRSNLPGQQGFIHKPQTFLNHFFHRTGKTVTAPFQKQADMSGNIVKQNVLVTGHCICAESGREQIAFPLNTQQNTLHHQGMETVADDRIQERPMLYPEQKLRPVKQRGIIRFRQAHQLQITFQNDPVNHRLQTGLFAGVIMVECFPGDGQSVGKTFYSDLLVGNILHHMQQRFFDFRFSQMVQIVD
jgi:hypothetical protein